MEQVSAKLSTALAPVQQHAHWLLRIALAAIFVFHAIDKISSGAPSQGGLDAMFFGQAFIFWSVAIAELLAGIAILAGGIPFPGSELLTRFGGLAIAVIMATAIVTVHLPEWYFYKNGAEMQTMLAAVGLWFFLRGNQGQTA